MRDMGLPYKNISVGNPNGKYISFSFAINNGEKVYEDTIQEGKILKILEATPIQDKEIIAELLTLSHKIDNYKIYG